MYVVAMDNMYRSVMLISESWVLVSGIFLKKVFIILSRMLMMVLMFLF